MDDSKANAVKTVAFEQRLMNFLHEEAYEDGLSVHQVVGVMAIVQAKLISNWEKDKRLPANLKSNTDI